MEMTQAQFDAAIEKAVALQLVTANPAPAITVVPSGTPVESIAPKQASASSADTRRARRPMTAASSPS